MYSIDEQFVVALKNKNYAEAERLLTEEGADINARNIRGETPLFFFAEAHSLKTLNWLVGKGADVNIPSEAGDSPLFAAVVRNDAVAVDALLNAGADVNAKNKRQIAPLMQAVLNEKDTGIFTRLLEAQPTIDPVSEQQTTPLLAAAARGKQEYVAKLLEAGADPEVVNYLGEGLLHAAVLSRDASILALVLEKAPLLDPNYAARSGTTPMSITVGFPEMMELLLERGGDPNAKSGNRFNDTSLLVGALVNGECDLPLKKPKEDPNAQGAANIQMIMGGAPDNDLVGKLLQKGADPKHRDEKGNNVLYYAIATGITAHFPALVAAGVDPARPCGPTPMLPYDTLMHPQLDQENPEVLQLIEQWHNAGFPFARPEWDEKVDGPWKEKYSEDLAPRHTVLQQLAMINFWPAVEKCLALNAPINERGPHDNTLAHTLVQTFNGMSLATKQALKLAAHAKNIDPATKEQQIEEIKEEARQQLQAGRDLVNRYGIDWNAQTQGGQTPLHVAAKTNNMEWAKYLVTEAKVDLTIRANNGLTAAGMALQEGHVEMFHVLCTMAAERNIDLRTTALLETTAASSDDFRERLPWLRAVSALTWSAEERNACNESGQNALYVAAATDQHDVVRTLLRLGCDANSADTEGNTALMQSVFNESGEVIRLLRAGGAKTTQANKTGATAMDVAEYVKSMYVHRALTEDNLGELIQDLQVDAPNEREQLLRQRLDIQLDNTVRSWKDLPLLEVPELPKEEPAPTAVSTAAAPPASVVPATPTTAPVAARSKGP